MYSIVERLHVWFAVNILWRLFPSLKQRQILSFSSTEFASYWYLREMIHNVRSPAVKIELYEQLLEEMAHSLLFLELAQKNAKTYIEPETAATQTANQNSLWRLAHFCFYGEKRALVRFEYIHKFTSDPELKKTIGSILEDECDHAHELTSLIEELEPPEGQTKAPSKFSMSTYFFRTAWLSAGTRLMNVIILNIFKVIYFLFGPFLYLASANTQRPMKKDLMKSLSGETTECSR